jgi:hypothetical protein
MEDSYEDDDEEDEDEEDDDDDVVDDGDNIRDEEDDEENEDEEMLNRGRHQHPHRNHKSGTTGDNVTWVSEASLAIVHSRRRDSVNKASPAVPQLTARSGQSAVYSLHSDAR